MECGRGMKGGEAVGKFVVYVPKTICCTEGSGVGWLVTFRLVSLSGGCLSQAKGKQTGGRVGEAIGEGTTHWEDGGEQEEQTTDGAGPQKRY